MYFQKKKTKPAGILSIGRPAISALDKAVTSTIEAVGASGARLPPDRPSSFGEPDYDPTVWHDYLESLREKKRAAEADPGCTVLPYTVPALPPGPSDPRFDPTAYGNAVAMSIKANCAPKDPVMRTGGSLGSVGSTGAAMVDPASGGSGTGMVIPKPPAPSAPKLTAAQEELLKKLVAEEVARQNPLPALNDYFPSDTDFSEPELKKTTTLAHMTKPPVASQAPAVTASQVGSYAAVIAGGLVVGLGVGFGVRYLIQRKKTE